MGTMPFAVETLLAPIPGDNPAGEDLRYTQVYEGIKEARRADDMLNQGDWQREVKRSDWAKVVELACDALSTRTKDLQIAVWLIEALIRRQGFAGLRAGLVVLETFLRDFWEHVWPLAEDGDLEFRAGPLEFLNDKVSLSVREIPMTDDQTTEGLSWNRWQESRQVGYEKDTKNQWGDVDEGKLRSRQESMAEGKIPAEAFDEAAAKTPREVSLALADDVDACMEVFTRLDALVDERFGRDAPRLTELKQAIEDCQRLAGAILKDKGNGVKVLPRVGIQPGGSQLR